jgi:hypothetical protein
MLEYFWLMPELGINSYERLREVRKEPMGFRVEAEGLVSGFYPKELVAALERICSAIDETSPKEATLVRGYFYDFGRHLQIIKRSQSRNGYYICVVGNSVIRKITVPTVDILIRIFENAGYVLKEKLRYEIRRHYMKFPRRDNSGKIVDDYVLIFRLA